MSIIFYKNFIFVKKMKILYAKGREGDMISHMDDERNEYYNV